jgi:hypothetical protein
MRTTITLEDDLAVHLERHRAERGMTFKEALNEAVRLGLASLETPSAEAPAAVARTTPLPLGRRLLADVDDVADALAIAEGEDFR